MSFVHRLTLGHLDPEAVRRRIRVVLRPLDRDAVNELLAQYTDDGKVEHPTFQGCAAEDHGDYLIVTLYSGPYFYGKAALFAVGLAAATDCLMADVENGRPSFTDDHQDLARRARAQIERTAR